MCKIIVFNICILFVFTITPVNSYSDFENNLLDGGWIEEINGVKILHLSGFNYEMGYQHGYLLKEECLQNLRAFINYSEYRYGIDYEDFKELWLKCKSYIPLQYIEEMQGMADAHNLSLEEVAVGNIANMYVHCSGLAAWGSATSNGDLLQMRSLDFPKIIKDPLSGELVQNNSILIIRKPSNAFSSIDPSFAGFIGSFGGFNEKGIAIEVLSSWSNDETFNGNPMVFRQRSVLDYAQNYSQAIDLLTNNKTLGWNHILSDAKKCIGFAIETTANKYYFGTWNNSIESTYPFWNIKNIVRRTNIFISPETASTQREVYNPLKLPLLNSLLGRNRLGGSNIFSFIPWIHYKALSYGIENNLGKLDLNSTMLMTRDVYRGSTYIPFKLFQVLNIYSSLHQWVANPKTGEIVISFSENDTDAFENSFHYFNFFELLNSEPP